MALYTWMIDATLVRATRAAAEGGKKGLERIARPRPWPYPLRFNSKNSFGV